MVESAFSRRSPNDMGAVYNPDQWALVRPTSSDRSLPTCSETVTRATGCPKRARPDLWGRPWRNLRALPGNVAPMGCPHLFRFKLELASAPRRRVTVFLLLMIACSSLALKSKNDLIAGNTRFEVKGNTRNLIYVKRDHSKQAVGFIGREESQSGSGGNCFAEFNVSH